MTPVEEIAPLADVSLHVQVELDSIALRVREILRLQANSVLKLTRSAGENLNIFIGDSLIGYGEIVVSETSVGVRITDFKAKE